MSRYLIFLCLLLTVLIEGCSAPVEEIVIPEESAPTEELRDLSNPRFVLDQLHEQYREWRGTRYRVGGLSKRGVDCSGFVYLTFRYKFGIELPRTTEEMADLGTKVDYGEWRAGDLLFFKTGIFDRHVGVYIKGGNFLHASTSQGVIISQIDNPYWQSTYWKAKRI